LVLRDYIWAVDRGLVDGPLPAAALLLSGISAEAADFVGGTGLGPPIDGVISKKRSWWDCAGRAMVGQGCSAETGDSLKQRDVSTRISTRDGFGGRNGDLADIGLGLIGIELPLVVDGARSRGNTCTSSANGIGHCSQSGAAFEDVAWMLGRGD
jgi:hypothetical protein